MSSETNAYYLKREYFGQNLNFRKREDTDLKSLCFRPDSLAQKNYEYRNPKILSVTNIVEKSSHIVNTEKTTTKSVPIKHIEGGWPEYVVNNSEVEKMQREMKNWVRAKEKTEFFEDKVKKLIANSTRILKQNLRMDIYEDYFEENPNSKMEDNFSAKIKMVFKDTEPYRRIVSKVAWMIPEDKEEQTKVAVAYKLHKDQEIPPNYKLPCLVWSMDNPNTPLNVLSCNSEILTVAFNTRVSHILGAGCANGTAVIFDLHTNKIIASTRLEDSHSEPISDFVWLKSKNGNEFVTSSTDGRVIWWEIRDMLSTTNPPTIVPDKPLYLVHKDAEAEKEYGGTKIEYNPDVGSTKFLIGTEQGIIFIANKKKQEAEANMKLGIIAGRHLGPIVGMQRCPHHPKFILSVGDWTARVWGEDLKWPLMISKFHPAYLTDCLWTSRIGMFFISRTDGWLNAYDLCYKTNEYSFSYKVCDSSITSMSLNIKGDRLVVGDEEGKIYLLKLSKSFYVSNDKTEIESKKNSLLKLLEREVTREKAVETILKKKGNLPKDDSQKQAKLDELIRTKIKKIEEEYFKTVGDILQNQGLREERKQVEEESKVSPKISSERLMDEQLKEEKTKLTEEKEKSDTPPLKKQASVEKTKEEVKVETPPQKKDEIETEQIRSNEEEEVKKNESIPLRNEESKEELNADLEEDKAEVSQEVKESLRQEEIPKEENSTLIKQEENDNPSPNISKENVNVKSESNRPENVSMEKQEEKVDSQANENAEDANRHESELKSIEEENQEENKNDQEEQKNEEN